ncbi:MAG: hypothetical protein EZS28_007255 [Streblomastix strix]|uniref:Uncharacterized protein n=1 Tax=Streblomastix strix TaxID=222440 RepID=A0A5J4WQJ2_9EUKA|nr:MAG: hypothetical protein EZS28_007255 [Streblomastix strix]
MISLSSNAVSSQAQGRHRANPSPPLPEFVIIGNDDALRARILARELPTDAEPLYSIAQNRKSSSFQKPNTSENTRRSQSVSPTNVVFRSLENLGKRGDQQIFSETMGMKQQQGRLSALP